MPVATRCGLSNSLLSAACAASLSSAAGAAAFPCCLSARPPCLLTIPTTPHPHLPTDPRADTRREFLTCVEMRLFQDTAKGKAGHLLAMRRLYASMQAFFRNLCTASKVDAVVKLAQDALGDDHAVVIGIQSTARARALGQAVFLLFLSLPGPVAVAGRLLRPLPPAGRPVVARA